MSIEFSFLLDSDMDLSAVAAWLQHNASMRPVEDANNYVMTSEGIVCTVMPQSELGRELISDVFESSRSRRKGQ